MENGLFTIKEASMFLDIVIRKKMMHFICYFKDKDQKGIYLLNEKMFSYVIPGTSIEDRNTLYKLCICLNNNLIELPKKEEPIKKTIVTILAMASDSQLKELYGSKRLNAIFLTNQFFGISNVRNYLNDTEF